MKWQLVVAEGRNAGKIIPMRKAELLIGRDEKCKLRARSQEISRRHCLLRLQGNSLVLRDLKSMNGTFVNDRAVQGEVELQDLDRLRIGPLKLIVRAEPTSIAASAAAEPTDEAIAAMMLEMEQETATVDDAEMAARTTTFADIPPPREQPADAPLDPTATMAKAILEKYRKRPSS
jgi:pSer/pThr/pTyr-binding forkhead associated (FHA) protein